MRVYSIHQTTSIGQNMMTREYMRVQTCTWDVISFMLEHKKIILIFVMVYTLNIKLSHDLVHDCLVSWEVSKSSMTKINCSIESPIYTFWLKKIESCDSSIRVEPNKSKQLACEL